MQITNKQEGPLNDWQCLVKVTQRRYKIFDYTTITITMTNYHDLTVLNNMWVTFTQIQYQINLSVKLARETGRDLTQSYDKSPNTDRKIQKATWQHKNDTTNFDYTTIADRLRTVSWGNDSHPTGVVKPVYRIPTFPLTTKAMLSKDTHLKNCK